MEESTDEDLNPPSKLTPGQEAVLDPPLPMETTATLEPMKNTAARQQSMDEDLNPSSRLTPGQEADLDLPTLRQFAKQHATSFRLISQQAHVVTLSFVQLSDTSAPHGVTAADCA